MSHNEKVITTLKQALADSYALYLKTQNYHWNVTGHNFHSLHNMFEGQYLDLAEAIDEIAERIRTLGDKCPGSFAEFDNSTNIITGNENAGADDMVADLAADNNYIAVEFKKFMLIAQEQHDEATADLFIKRIEVHEKNAWMLTSSL